METTILSDLGRIGRGGAGRRLLSGLNRSAPTAAGDRKSRDTQLGDAFWDAGGARVARKRQVQWFEQAELWKDDAEPAADPEPAVAEATPAPVEPIRVARAMEAIDEMIATRATSEARNEATSSFRTSQRSVRMAEIAKFLQVNQALDGINADQHRFSLPLRRFAASFSRSLWKGSPVGTHFVTGC